MNNYIEVFKYDYNAKWQVKIYQDNQYTGIIALCNTIGDLLRVAREYGCTELKRGY